jgi:hypothetical protein
MEAKDYVDEIVSNWPEFTGEQINRLTELLKPVRITAESKKLVSNGNLI